MLYVRKTPTKKQIEEHAEWLAKHATKQPTKAELAKDSQSFFAKRAASLKSRDRTSHIPSRDTAGGTTPHIQSPQYTGAAAIGIATMHKSNAIPVFSEKEAIEVATMRRN